MKRVRITILGTMWALFVGALAGSSAASLRVDEYRLKAEFIERFTRFIEWPRGALPQAPESSFVIGVLGKNPFGTALRDLAARRKIAGRTVKVKQIARINDIHGCQVLFVATSEAHRVDDIVAATHGQPVLTIGDCSKFADDGLLMGFFVDKNKVGFEIYESAVADSGLQFSAKLLKLARLVGKEE